MARNNYMDYEFIELVEGNYTSKELLLAEKGMIGRYCFAALYGYYRMNMPMSIGFKYWEDHMEKHHMELLNDDIMDLMDAIYLNRNFPLSYFMEKLDRIYKPCLLANWNA
jgi:hypothetical protein